MRENRFSMWLFFLLGTFSAGESSCLRLLSEVGTGELAASVEEESEPSVFTTWLLDADESLSLSLSLLSEELESEELLDDEEDSSFFTTFFALVFFALVFLEEASESLSEESLLLEESLEESELEDEDEEDEEEEDAAFLTFLTFLGAFALGLVSASDSELELELELLSESLDESRRLYTVSFVHMSWPQRRHAFCKAQTFVFLGNE